ncbi:MAG: DUF2911 domain-containing protein [Gemmatimonas sp.]|nr:DUF2911 domain-containing protein [Gemmatimonas sp.]
MKLPDPIILPFAALLVTASCAAERGERWGFVATLGDDTTSVERVTRSGDRIVSEAIETAPMVVRRRWEATLAPDGSLRRWTMDTHIPNALPGETDLHHEMELSGGEIRLVRQTGSETTDRTVADPYARTLPWNAFVYGTYDLLMLVAHDLPDSTSIGQYFFEGWSDGNIGIARLTRSGDGTVTLNHFGIGGRAHAEVDEHGRMLSFSGAGTTNLQEARRVAEVPDLDALFTRLAAEEKARGPSPSLSPRDAAHAEVGGATLSVDYGRPFARGRSLLGGIIPYDRVWRTGANAATHLTVTAPIRLAGVPLDEGTYTLWTLPGREGVRLIINQQTGQWGTAYGPAHDIARVPMETETLEDEIEQFAIRVDPAGPRLVMEWGTFRWSSPIEVGPNR